MMQHRFFNLDGTPLEGFGGQRPLPELIANLKRNFDLDRNEYAVFEFDPMVTLVQGNVLGVVDSTDALNPVVTSVVSDTVKNTEELKQKLGLYAEEQSLKHGASMIDPNSATFETVADATGNLNEIRQKQGRSRAKMHNSKARGADGGNSSVVGSKARNNAAQAIEESLGVALVDIEIDIAIGAITTEAEIDARIYSVNLTY